MKKIIIVLCFLTIQLKAQIVKTDTLQNKTNSNLLIRTINTKAIFIDASKDISISSTARITLTPSQSSGIILGGRIGIGSGSNWSAHSPVSCIDYPVYLSQTDAILNGLDEGDHYLILVSGSYLLAVVHIP